MKHTYLFRRILATTTLVILAAALFSCTEKETDPVDPNPNDTTVTPNDPLPTLPLFGGEVRYHGDTAHVNYMVIDGPRKKFGIDGVCTMMIYFDNSDFASISFPDFEGDSASFTISANFNDLNRPDKCNIDYLSDDSDEYYTLRNGTLTLVRLDADTYHITFSCTNDYNDPFVADITSQYFDHKHPIGTGSYQFRDQEVPLQYAYLTPNEEANTTYYYINDLIHGNRISFRTRISNVEGEYQIVEFHYPLNDNETLVYCYEEGTQGTEEYPLTGGTLTITRQGKLYTIEISGTTAQGPITLTYTGCFFNRRTLQFAD